MIVSVDFDGTLCEHKFPGIGSPNVEVINLIKRFQSQGHKIILWTCRDGEYLDEAVKWCLDFGLVFDAVNDNLPEIKYNFYELSSKVYADIYIDDKNYCLKCGKGTKIK